MLIRHKIYPQLLGKLERRENENYGVIWLEPWLAATLLEGDDLFWVSKSDYEVLSEDEELVALTNSKTPRNVTCTNCYGKGYLRVFDRREVLKVGPHKVCYKCRGTGKIRAGVD